MKIIFAHDEKLQKEKGSYFTTGSLGNSLETKYLKCFENINLIMRSEEIHIDKSKKLRKINNEKINIIEVEDYNNLNIFKRKRIRQKIAKEIKVADKVIARLPSNNGEIAIKYAKKFNKPYAIELVGCPLDTYNNHGSLVGKIIAPIKYLKTKRIVKNGENVLYVTKKFLQKRYPNKGINQVACSDVEIDEVRWRLGDNWKGIENKTIKIGIIGTLTTKYKGHETIFKAIAKLKEEFDIQLVIVGYGEIEKWNKMIYDLNIEENVIFEGTKKSGKEIFEWLDKIDIYVQPSLTEGMPRSTIEAMSRGCPIVTTNVGGFPEINCEEFMIEKLDWEAMYDKLKLLVLDKEKYRKHSERSSKVSEEFLREKIIKEQKKFYRNIN